VAALLAYTVLTCDAGRIAVPPVGPRLGGTWPPAFALRVERVVNMGNHPHLLGRVGDVRIDLRLAAGEAVPAPGTEIRVGATSFVALS
jgi:hypothetical protein